MASVHVVPSPEARSAQGISQHTAPPRTLRLPDWNRQEWTRRAALLRFPDYRDLGQWVEFRDASVRLAREFLPLTTRQALGEFFAPAGPPALVLENLPVDPELPPVPTDGMRPEGKQAVSEAAIVGIICQWGEVLSFLNEKGGCPVHQITPIAGMENSQSNAGRVRFGYHSDNAFLPTWFRQQGIMLYGLLNQNTATTVVTADQMLEAAPAELAAILARPLFRHACPASYSFAGTPVHSAPCPILWRDDRGLARVSAASSSIEPLRPEAASALNRFRELLDGLEPARIIVGPGTALLFKDDRMLHGRDAFSGPRWLQRAYFTDSLALLREVTGSEARAFAFDARALLSPRHTP
jgi:L-asparagine oxygenase